MNPDLKASPMRSSLPRLVSGGLLAAAVLAGAVGGAARPAGASSHREAPLISRDASADNTDVYAFISPDRPDAVTLIANWIPFEHADGGPNFNSFADDVRYEIHVDQRGQARADLTYRLEFTTRTMNPATFLYNTGPVTSLDDEHLNVRQTYTLTEIRRDAAGQETATVLGTGLAVPPPNIGSKSTPGYAALAQAGVHTLPSPSGDIRAFAGPRDDPFFVDLGSVFDLLSLRGQKAPIGYGGRGPGIDGLAGYNVHSVALQVPIERLAITGQPVIGVWATSSRQSIRTLAPLGQVQGSGAWVQISRLGMPLTNEVVLPRALKDAFNGLEPRQDYDLFSSQEAAGKLLAASVLRPELGKLLGGLYGVPTPEGDRMDLVSIFLTGMVTTKPFTLQTPGGPATIPAGTNVNQPAEVRPAEMLRLNTAAAFRPGVTGSLCGKPNHALGLLAGDACGFPNGRRLADDVTDISLLAVAGAASSVLTGGDFAFDTSLIKVLRDDVSANDMPFLSGFPYLAVPHQGQEHGHSSAWRAYMAFGIKMH